MKEVRVYIADIWECIEKIEDYARGATFADFSKNSALQRFSSLVPPHP